MNLRTQIAFVLLTIVSISAKAQEPIDLFSDEPRLSTDFIRIACWSLQHFNLQPGADVLLPVAEEDEDIAILVKTYAKNLSQNRRGLAHFAESSEQNVPVPLSGKRFWDRF